MELSNPNLYVVCTKRFVDWRIAQIGADFQLNNGSSVRFRDFDGLSFVRVTVTARIERCVTVMVQLRPDLSAINFYVPNFAIPGVDEQVIHAEADLGVADVSRVDITLD